MPHCHGSDFHRLLAALLLSVGAVGCAKDGSAPPSPGEDRRSAFAVNYPLAYFARRIAGESVEVSFPAPAHVDPAHWSPEPDTIIAFQQADLILLNGAGYARWTTQASLPLSTLVDTSAAFEDRYLTMDESVTHQHGPEGEHAHRDLAFTTWLDSTLAVRQARAIQAAFARTWPDDAAAFETNFELLQQDLESIDADYARILSGRESQPLLTSHPVYQYFTRRYDLTVISVHWEPDEEPTREMWSELEAILADHSATLMLWEAEPLSETRIRLAEFGITCVVFNPCGNTPANGDFLKVMRTNIEALGSAIPASRDQ